MDEGEFCIENDESCIKVDGSCIENDEFCIENDAFATWMKSDESEIVDIITESFAVYMEIISGDGIKVYGTLCDGAGWDTVRASKQVLGGKWYYEIMLGDKATGQIGFARSDFGIFDVVAICIKIDEFCSINEGFCIKNDDFNANG